MAAILRVKRRYEDEPLSALVIACKRLKTDNNKVEEPSTAAPLTAVVTFAGTVVNQENEIVEKLVKNINKDDLKSNFKQHTVDITAKVRDQTKRSSTENRYKVINCCRSLNTSNVEHLEDKVVNVIDVEDSVSCSVKGNADTLQENNYVYDLYYASTTEDISVDNVVSIHSLDQEFVFDNYRSNGGHSECEQESEDSNSESNWRNDYPDSEHSENSINEEDLERAVLNVKLDDNSDLSSDDDFVYGINEDDVDRYGYKYARYKARIKDEFDEDDSELSEYSGICISEEPEGDNGDDDV